MINPNALFDKLQDGLYNNIFLKLGGKDEDDEFDFESEEKQIEETNLSTRRKLAQNEKTITSNYWFKDDPNFKMYMKLACLKKKIKCQSFYQSLIGNLELKLQDKIIKVYFRKPFISNYLSDIIKMDLIWGANRETNQKRYIAFHFVLNIIL